MFRGRVRTIHFVGIGGIGMSGIAEVLLSSGFAVTGSDARASDTTRRLEELGAKCFVGHRTDQVGDADVVVFSSAVTRDNPELVEARARNIPVIPRAEMLAELMRVKQGIAIAGSHGKTTTTSMVAFALHEAGIDPTVVIGGKVNAFDSNARLGAGDVLVAEADESDGSFLYLSPTIAVITNIDHEHMDHWASFDQLVDAFVGFANRVPFYGMAVVCLDDPTVRAMLPRLHKRTITYGFSPDADYVASEVVHEGLTTRFRVRARGRDEGDFVLRMPGRHNVLNALATIAVCDEQEVPPAILQAALGSFAGVQRRFTVRGEGRGVLVVDDYGHHPTEIAATLAGARTSHPGRRLIAAVQPHRYTRLRDNFAAFVRCLDPADQVWLTDVYPAGEAPVPGVDSAALAAALRERTPTRPIVHVPAVGDLAARLAAGTAPGDIVVTLGAGSITRVSHDLAAALAT
jgi:UDP-N-acetylmuramate--alanine ligase